MPEKNHFLNREESLSKRKEELKSKEFVFRGLNAFEIDSFDDQDNFYLSGRKRSALEVVTSNGDIVNSEKLADPGFSATLNKTVGIFGKLSAKILISEIEKIGGKVLVSPTSPDYYYVQIPEGKQVKITIEHGDKTYARLGALTNMLSSDEKQYKYVITPFAENPVSAGFRLPEGEIKISYRKNQDSLIIDSMSPEIEKTPRFFHSLVLSILLKLGYEDERFKIKTIKLPNRETYSSETYLSEITIQKLREICED